MKLLGISYRDHITSDAIRYRIRQAIGPNDNVLTTVKKGKFGLGIYQDQQGLPKQFHNEQYKEEEEEADKRSVWRITSVSGQG